MNSQWLDAAVEKMGRTGQLVLTRAAFLNHPTHIRQLRMGLLGVLLLWLLATLVQLFWSFLPAPPLSTEAVTIVNPLQSTSNARPQAAVDIEQMVDWNLFGTADSVPLPAADKSATVATDLQGVEDNARETRLNLKLQGIVASSEPSKARAIIENQRAQEQYGVGDKLPVAGEVTVAKILADRVVLNNGGSYELLILFDKSAISAQPMESVVEASEASEDEELTVDNRGNRDVTAIAGAYRQRLYNNPQSLSDVVKIAAVREDGQLRGYRVSAGKDREQFASMGFQANDIVTGVNGVELTDPGKAMELYRIMRSAEEASFNVRRGDEDLTLVVGLQSSTDSQ